MQLIFNQIEGFTMPCYFDSLLKTLMNLTG